MVKSFFLIIFFLFLLPSVSFAAIPPGYTDAGFDPGITKKCYKNNQKDALSEPYQDLTECTDNKFWRIGFWSEKSYNPEDACRNTFNLNDPASPVKFLWNKQNDNTYHVRIINNFIDLTHPCGAKYFNWAVLNDQGNGPYPKPNKIATYAQLFIRSYFSGGTNNGSQYRVSFIWTGKWNGKSKQVVVTVNRVGYEPTTQDRRIIAKLNRDDLDLMHVDGAFYNITLADSTYQEIFINWKTIINDLIQAGYLDNPTNWNESETNGVMLGTETFNKTVSNALLTDLRIDNFRILEQNDNSPEPSQTPVATTANNSIENFENCYDPQNAITQNSPCKIFDLNKDNFINAKDYTLFLTSYE